MNRVVIGLSNGTKSSISRILVNGPHAKYVILRVAHAPGMPGMFSPPPRVSDPDMHHGTRVTHVPWCMPGSLTSGYLWSRRRGKRSRHCRRIRNPQFNVSGKRPIGHLATNFSGTWMNMKCLFLLKNTLENLVYKIATRLFMPRFLCTRKARTANCEHVRYRL